MKFSDDCALAHALARVGLGMDIALHGYGRLPHLDTFSAGLQKEFAQSILPASMVYASGWGIAIGEAIIGTLLLLGLLLRPALVAGMLLMIVLLFGTCLIQNWNGAGVQLTYVAFYAALLATATYDRYSLDGWRGKSSNQ